MAILDRFREQQPNTAVAVLEADERVAVAEATAALATDNLQAMVESYADAQLALDDVGWRLLSDQAVREFDREGLRRASALAELMVVGNPLMRRGQQLRIAYVWGSGVQVEARDNGDEGGQDVNAVVQAFWDDPSNRPVLTGPQAGENLERAIGSNGNVALALYTSPLTGRVQVRSIPFAEIEDVLCNPEDRDDPWFYLHAYSSTKVVATPGTVGADGVRGTARTETVTENVKVYYPALGYWPRQRPKTIDGYEVRWEAPMLLGSVNKMPGWKFGIGDAYAAMFWARGYKEFLEDWARLVRSLSRFAWKATAKTAPGRRQAREAFTTTAVEPAPGGAGAAAVVSPDANLEAIPKTGATIDSDSGRPLAAMVAAAWGVPVTMLLGDPGQTGARAVAETLDQPTELEMVMRRAFWSEIIKRVCDYVVDQAVRAPQGPLKGTVLIDPVTGRTSVTLAGDEDRTVDVTWPDLGKESVEVLVNAIAKAHETGTVPDEVVSRLLLQALGVQDVDELIAELTAADGTFEAPSTAKASADAAAAAALAQYRAGGLPEQPPAGAPAA